MRRQGAVGAAVQAVSASARRQRNALAASDPAAINAASQELLQVLANLQHPDRGYTREELRALRAAHVGLQANMELLGRLSAANSGALRILFDTPATYGPAGAAADRDAAFIRSVA